jgi:sigma-B regulation protein RsbU (phosphoserine phosphatase)
LRISIRWKLLLAVGLPALLLYAFVVVAGAIRLRARGVERLQEVAGRLAAAYGERLDAEFRSVAQIPRSTAALLQAQPALDDAVVTEMLRGNVEQSPLISASCLIFGPDADGSPDWAAMPCAIRDGDTIRLIDRAVEPGYDGYREKEWFRKAVETGVSAWSEPFRLSPNDADGLLTFVVPFRSAGGPAGFTTVDVPLAEVREHLGTIEVGTRDFSILSSAGTYILHPDSSIVLAESIFSLAERTARPDLADLGRRMLAGSPGVERIRMLDEPGHQWVFYAPIPSAGWTFVSAVPEAQVLAFSNDQLRRGLVIVAIGLAVILGTLLVVVNRITRPLGHLVGAVGELSRGNLDVEVTEVESEDEIGKLARVFNRMTTDLKAHVETHARETAEREAVESELRVARNIQMSMLPQRYPPFPAHREFDLHAISLPARQVGGDFFDYFFLTNETLVLLMADVSGKGIPAALFMAVARTVVRDLSPGSASPAVTLTRANRALNEDNVGSMFVTMFLGWYNIRTGVLRYANAGHPLPYRIRTDGSVEASGEVTGPVLGILDGKQYREAQVQIEAGERILLYTDGIPEAISPTGDFFGEERFAELIAESVADPAERLLQKVAVKVESFQDHVLQDDLTLLLLQRNA